MKLTDILEDHYAPLAKYDQLGGTALSDRQIGYLTFTLKVPPQAIVAKEMEFKKKFKKDNKFIANKVVEYFKNKK